MSAPEKPSLSITIDARNLSVVQELCTICQKQNDIIMAQADALAQVGAMVMEEERQTTSQRLAELVGFPIEEN